MLPIQYYVVAKRREESSVSPNFATPKTNAIALDNCSETDDLPGVPMVVTIAASFLAFAFLVGMLAYNLR